jgi:broad specificity phosphatase PhoE
MSDLQCAATLLVARHAEAVPATPGRGDAGGSLTRAGRAQAQALGRALADARLARIYTGPRAGAVQTAEIVAAQTGAVVEIDECLAEPPVGGSASVQASGDRSGAEVRARVGELLQHLGDLHRGETVLVVSDAGTIATAVPPLLGLPEGFAADRPVPPAAVVEVAVDGDGWTLRAWPEPAEAATSAGGGSGRFARSMTDMPEPPPSCGTMPGGEDGSDPSHEGRPTTGSECRWE